MVSQREMGGNETVILILGLVAVVGLAQVALLVITHHTLSPLASVLTIKVAEFVPMADPFLYHWYEGEVPPLTGVALKVSAAPLLIAVAVAVILTDGVHGTAAVTVSTAEPE